MLVRLIKVDKIGMLVVNGAIKALQLKNVVGWLDRYLSVKDLVHFFGVLDALDPVFLQYGKRLFGYDEIVRTAVYIEKIRQSLPMYGTGLFSDPLHTRQIGTTLRTKLDPVSIVVNRLPRIGFRVDLF